MKNSFIFFSNKDKFQIKNKNTILIMNLIMKMNNID